MSGMLRMQFVEWMERKYSLKMAHITVMLPVSSLKSEGPARFLDSN